MRRVYKYGLTMGRTDLLITAGARFLAFGMQPDQPVMWMEVEPDRTITDLRTFEILPTGGEVADGMLWLGTTQDGPYVWHLYERLGS